MQKNGTGEHIPPPRPKRKSAQPYPQKSSAGGRGADARKKRNAGAGAASASLMAGGMAGGMRAGAPPGAAGLGNQGMGRSPMGGGAGVPLEYGAPGPMGGGYLVHARGAGGSNFAQTSVRGDARWAPPGPGLAGAHGMPHSGSLGSPYGSSHPLLSGGALRDSASFGGGSFGGLPWTDAPNGGGGANDASYVQRNARKHPTSHPDFVVVYTFLAGLFDPAQRGHGEKLRNMAPINRETALLLMRNLGANLMCQRMWEDQIQLIGQGYPTFVNATYDDRGGLTGAAGGHAIEASAAVGDGDGTSGDGSGDGADGARPERDGSGAGSGGGGSDEEGGVGGAGEGDARGEGEAGAANDAGGPEAGSRGGSPVENPEEEGKNGDGDGDGGEAGDGGDEKRGDGDGTGDANDGGGAEPSPEPAVPPGDAVPLSAFLA